MTTAATARQPWLESKRDAVLAGVALLLALPSVFYPFGGDQGLYFYVGREWLHGSVPYRDAMEQKTPLVFLLHAALVFVTGPNMWAIRVAEVVWVLSLGVPIAALATPAGERRRPGILGLACLSTALLYFGLFDYWDTAQCEIWYAGLSVWSLWAVLRRPARPSTWLLGGIFAGLAWLMKPPATFLLLVVGAALLVRAWRAAPAERRLHPALAAGGLYVAGALAPVALVGAYFFAAGALDDLVDLAFLANYHDMRHSSTVFDAADVARKFGEFGDKAGLVAPGSLAAALVGLGCAARRRSPERAARHAVALALIVAGCVAVLVQRKFYGYHWGALAPLAALALGGLAHDLGRRLGGTRAVVLLAALLALAFATSQRAAPYGHTVNLTVQYLAGRIDRAAFLAPFVAWDNTPYVQQEAVGLWLRAHSAPEDRVAVRGFEQTVYAVADRRAPTRFFWTRWLTEPRRVYRRAEWLAEDRAALRRDPPRYVVVNARAMGGPASKAYFQEAGYVERFRHGLLIVLERAQP